MGLGVMRGGGSQDRMRRASGSSLRSLKASDDACFSSGTGEARLRSASFCVYTDSGKMCQQYRDGPSGACSVNGVTWFSEGPGQDSLMGGQVMGRLNRDDSLAKPHLSGLSTSFHQRV